MDIHGNKWQYMAVHGNTWQCMAIHGNTWQNMVIHGNTWQCMAIHGSAWQYMVIHGNTWQCMVIHGNTWQYMVTHDWQLTKFLIPLFCTTHYLVPRTHCDFKCGVKDRNSYLLFLPWYMSIALYSHMHGLGCQPMSRHSLQDVTHFFSYICLFYFFIFYIIFIYYFYLVWVPAYFQSFQDFSLETNSDLVTSLLSTSNSFLYFITSAWKDFIFSDRVHTFHCHHVIFVYKLKPGMSQP